MKKSEKKILVDVADVSVQIIYNQINKIIARRKARQMAHRLIATYDQETVEKATRMVTVQWEFNLIRIDNIQQLEDAIHCQIITDSEFSR